MESNGKFTLIVFNTCTQEYEEVIVTEEVYHAYCRTRWNIKDNDESFFDHEIQTSGMIGSQDGAYENFREFIDAINTPEHIILEQMKERGPVPSDLSVACCGSGIGTGVCFLRDKVNLTMQERLAFHSLQCINGKSVFSSL